MEDVSGLDVPTQICVIGQDLNEDKAFVDLCKTFGLPVVKSNNGMEYFDDRNVRTIFVLDQFSGKVFEKLSDARKHILGPPAIKDLVNNSFPLLMKRVPVYCIALHECVIVLNGIRKKADIERVLRLIHNMGGSVKKDVDNKTTHVLAASSLGEKYQYANTFCIPVLKESWLTNAWDNRENVGFRATIKENYEKYRLLPFEGNIVQFFGFEENELNHMKDLLVKNGGRLADSAENSPTHLVIDENNIDILPEELELKNTCHIVKSVWFWDSIQIEAAAEVSRYKWEREDGSATAPLLSPNISCSVFSPPTPQGGTSASNRKRKRLRRAELIQSLAADSPAYKRRSSVSELGALSVSGNFLDTSVDKDRTLVTPENSPQRGCTNEAEIVKNDREHVFDMKTATPRQQVSH